MRDRGNCGHDYILDVGAETLQQEYVPTRSFKDTEASRRSPGPDGAKATVPKQMPCNCTTPSSMWVVCGSQKFPGVEVTLGSLSTLVTMGCFCQNSDGQALGA